jgi:hypothetical protein
VGGSLAGPRAGHVPRWPGRSCGHDSRLVRRGRSVTPPQHSSYPQDAATNTATVHKNGPISGSSRMGDTGLATGPGAARGCYPAYLLASGVLSSQRNHERNHRRGSRFAPSVRSGRGLGRGETLRSCPKRKPVVSNETALGRSGRPSRRKKGVPSRQWASGACPQHGRGTTNGSSRAKRCSLVAGSIDQAAALSSSGLRCSEAVTNAWTTAVSNWVPAQRTSSRHASS